MKKMWTIKSSPSVASSRAPPTSENSPKLLHFRSTQFVRHQYLHQFSSGRWATDLEKRMMCTITMQERNMIFCSLLSPPRKYEKSWWLLEAMGLISAERQHESSGLPLHPHLKPLSNTKPILGAASFALLLYGNMQSTLPSSTWLKTTSLCSMIL